MTRGAGSGSGTSGNGFGFGAFGTGGIAPASLSMGSTRSRLPWKRTRSVAWRTRVISTARLPEFMRHHSRLQEIEQVLRAAGLAVGPGHVEAAEGMGADQRARALAVEVEVAAHELPPGL